MSQRPELERVAVALDTAVEEEFRDWCAYFGPRVGALKVGLEAYARFGRAGVRLARRHGRRLFLDLKLHDIPNTVGGAVRAAAGMKADLLTVHVAGGRPMLEAAVEAASDRLELLGVTLLTHLDRGALAELGLGDPSEVVEQWAAIAAQCGLDGVVCSPRELERLRPAYRPPFRLVTPGIRWSPDQEDDQRRVATPEAALAGGSDLLVVGRPLTRAKNPDRALRELSDRLLRQLSE